MNSHKNRETIIITGAGGFVGINFLEYFTEKGYRVIGLEKNKECIEEIENCGAEAVICDLLCDDIESIFNEGDYLLHVAGLFRFDVPLKALYLINAKLVDVVMRNALKANFKHIIHFSTTATYGNPNIRPIDENIPQKPNDMYGLTKLKGEQIAWKYYKEYNLPITVIRPTLIYGPRNPFGMGLFIALGSLMIDGLKIKNVIGIKGASHMHLVHVEDLARACEFLMKRDDTIGEAYNIADDNPIPLDELMANVLSSFKGIKVKNIFPFSKNLIKRITKLAKTKAFDGINKILQKSWESLGERGNFDGKKIIMHLSPEWMEYLHADFKFSNKKLRDLGFEFKYPHPKEGVIQNILWYRQNRWMP